MRRALDEYLILGVKTTIPFHRWLLDHPDFRAGRIDSLGELRPFSKYLTVRSFVYLARDLVPSRLVGDEGYDITVQPVPLASFETLIGDGRLLDARVIASLSRPAQPNLTSMKS